MSNIKFDWNDSFKHAQKYYERIGNLFVGEKYIDETGFQLGKWLYLQRKYFKNGRLDDVKKKRLDQIGMVWDFSEFYWWIKMGQFIHCQSFPL